MTGAYTGWHARTYDAIWRHFEERTLSETVKLIDVNVLAAMRATTGRWPRLLDVACGTGLLLRRLRELLPEAEAYGVDASADMLAQARWALDGRPHADLVQAVVGSGPRAALPFERGTFDLVACTNALHYFPDPVAALAGLIDLVAPGGQFVLEDYARREPPFPWPLFEWIVRQVDAGHVCAYTLEEARRACAAAGLQIARDTAFAVDWLWHAWALRAQATVPA